MTKTCDKADTFCQHCAKRHAGADCRAVVKSLLLKGNGACHLWPPNPTPESWYSDTPNEGLLITVYPSKNDSYPNIVDSFADYHGFFIVEPAKVHSLDSCYGVCPRFAPTTNQQYLAAYRAVLEAFEPNWYNPAKLEGTWFECCYRLIGILLSMGWHSPETHPLRPADAYAG